MDKLIEELIKSAPFGPFAVVCLIILSRYYQKAIKVISNVNDKSIEEIRNAYKNANKYRDLNKK